MRPRAKQPRRHPRLLLSLLGLLILVEVITVIAVLASQRYATERALQQYTQELLQNVVDETRQNAARYLSQAQDSVSLLAAILGVDLIPRSQADRVERYLLEQLRVLPQIDALYFGSTSGDFVFSKRQLDDKNDGFLSKIIQSGGTPAQRVTLINRNRAFIEVSRRFTPDDTYDPRQRPWYVLAESETREVWTRPYIFYTSQQPGLTVASAVRDADGTLLGVVGADIELSMLSQFLRTQRIGRTGAAFIVHSDGGVLAHPGADQLAQRDNGDRLRLKQLTELDPVAARAGALLKRSFPNLVTLNYNHLDWFEFDGERYLSMYVPLLNHGNNRWVMGVYAPEDELAGTIRRGQRESITLGVAMSLLMITAATLIGLLLLRPIGQLHRQAAEDPLTGLSNRRSFNEEARNIFQQAADSGSDLTALMIDIDNFKPINDEFGHAVGDEVLRVIAQRIRHGLSEQDLLSRYGGEEFAAMLPGADGGVGPSVAERLRELVGAESVHTSAGPLDVTISLGVAHVTAQTATVEDLLDLADQRLLRAKREGRNRVVGGSERDPQAAT